ncbi:hypothetical protein [Streptomyces sp. NPDC048496]|uniref:hypothetical protein n=1 Tax=Streptomyces sp. NPDC048496 TaxID=3365558 RepID=UPI003724587C
MSREGSKPPQTPVVFTAITQGRAGRLPDDGNWRRQTWWPTVADDHCFETDGEQRLDPHDPPHSGHKRPSALSLKDRVTLVRNSRRLLDR